MRLKFVNWPELGMCFASCCSQWLQDLTTAAAAAEDTHQHSYAQAALRRLLVNDPCTLAAAAGIPAAHTISLLQAGREMWDAVKALPAEQSSRVRLRRLWMLLHVLVRLPPTDMRVTRFHTGCKVSLYWQPRAAQALVKPCKNDI